MTKQQRSQETRAHLLSVATRSFARNGYNATGVAEICEQAGVSKGAFYYHFPSKQSVFLELLNSWLFGLEQSLETAIKETETVPESLLNMARMMQTLLVSDSEIILVFLEFWTQASRNEVVRQATIEPYQRYQAFFTKLIEQGIEEGSLEHVNPASGAQALISLASGLFFQGVLDPKGSDWSQVTADSIQILLDGLRRRA